MNLKTTLTLVILVAAGATAWFVIAARQPEETPSPTLAFLETELTPANLTRIEIVRGDRRVLLERNPGQQWSLPGNWPVRKPEVEQLVNVLTGLRSRFVPVSLGEEKELRKY